MIDDLPTRLTERLQQPLPGAAAHRRFAPDLSYARQAGPAPSDARRAAVMILLYPHNGCWHLPLTVRPDHLPDHPGQISLPGGMLEYGESTRTAALRELQEELGIGADIEILGKLSPLFVYVSNFLVTPWIGALSERPQFQPSADEVADVLEVPLDHLLTEENIGDRLVSRRGVQYRAPHFCWEEHCVWGATAMMLSELVEVLR